MIWKRIWESKRPYKRIHREGWFLLGIIPLYVRDTYVKYL
jgi:hypothetical protein